MTTSRQDADFLDDVIGNGLLDNSITWIQQHLGPEDVFDKAQLDAWAESNGYTKGAE